MRVETDNEYIIHDVRLTKRETQFRGNNEYTYNVDIPFEIDEIQGLSLRYIQSSNKYSLSIKVGKFVFIPTYLPEKEQISKNRTFTASNIFFTGRWFSYGPSHSMNIWSFWFQLIQLNTW